MRRNKQARGPEEFTQTGNGTANEPPSVRQKAWEAGRESGEPDSTKEERERVAKEGPVAGLLLSGHGEVRGWGAWGSKE